ncbi:MAG: hypothetical protein NVS1B9_12680 [Solirubrobacteraceae bacterium]
MAAPQNERDRAFFRRFPAPTERGALLGTWREGQLVGYACLPFTFSSVKAIEAVVMNDPFVAEPARGAGAGRELIMASARLARERGVATLAG